MKTSSRTALQKLLLSPCASCSSKQTSSDHFRRILAEHAGIMNIQVAAASLGVARLPCQMLLLVQHRPGEFTDSGPSSARWVVLSTQE